MSKSGPVRGLILSDLIEKLDKIELRVNNIEKLLDLPAFDPENVDSNHVKAEGTQDISDSETVESKIGEFGLAWLGAIVLLLSISFLMTYLYENGFIIFSSLLGYSVAAGIFIFTYFGGRSIPYLVLLLTLIGHILIYYTTLRLHFFSTQPLISSTAFILILLSLAIGTQLYFAMRRKSELLAGLAILLMMATAIIADATHVSLSIVSLTAAVTLSLLITHSWWRLFLITIVLVYFCHFLWLLNNPMMGNPIKAVNTHQFNFVYLAGYGILFSSALLVQPQKKLPENIFPAIFFINGISFFVICMLVILTFFQENYAGMGYAISVFCILFSILLNKKTTLHYAPSFYACFGFMALSMGMVAMAGLPAAYPLLTLQSLLVVSMALWFKSRIIVVVNTLLFVFFLLAYLISAPSENFTNFAVVFTALATARIINWQRERLTLKTEMMRNAYLISAFFMVLFSLYHAVPGKHITLAWAGAAIVYFILSIWLQNVKYRWMAILTLISACIYLFTIDLAKMEIGYSIVAFLVLAIISISASLYYTKRSKKRT
ncbi:MAG: hypothetical protein DWQ05_14695 [Calditrichaeota bacterium]|nr:MAG: hypothetical protein DWQ05_14695 [Calditrichota bacterium]